MERTIQGKVAGLRTQTIVGTSSALILLVSKYGFGDVLSAQTLVLDPSRVAAQVVSGIGFLGAGLLLLAAAVVALHFVSALAFNVVERQLTARLRGTVRLQIVYDNGQGVLRTILRVCGQRNWQLTELDADDGNIDRDQVAVAMTLSGNKIGNAAQVLAAIDGVSAVLNAEDEPD